MSYRIERDGSEITLSAPRVLKDRAKAVPGGRYDKRTQSWRYPLTWAHCVMLRGEFGAELSVGPGLASWAAEERARRVDVAMELREVR